MSFGAFKTLLSVGKNISNDYTVPVFKCIHKEAEYETRLYNRNYYISFKYKSDSNRNGDDHLMVMKNLWRLVKYTQGENEKNIEMKFCMPVFVLIEHIDGSDPEVCEVKLMISLPPEYQSNHVEIPKPNDPELYVELLDTFECYVRTFSGYANEAIFKTETNKLRDSLKKVDKKVIKNKCICISYDPPYKAFNRRNEVILIAA